MRANYGYEDGTGSYYITIETDKCAQCGEKRCVAVCPAQLLTCALDDFDEEMIMVRSGLGNQTASLCSGCKPNVNRPPLPCQEACPHQAIDHSW